ncbi:MAG: STAS domain-containing protein [Lachnospiraceae bacterium]|nr:STAS domain-containing protein [Lachnospiraceae bacterium]
MSEVLTYKADERVDTRTVEKFSQELKDILDKGQYDLEIDMSDTVYISSVGLRVLLSTQKEIDKHGGSMVIKKTGPAVKKVFEVTGFIRLFRIED